MSAASRVKALPLLRPSLLSRSTSRGACCCYYSSTASARALPGPVARRPPSSSPPWGIGATAARAGHYQAVRWNSTGGSSSSSAGSDDDGSVASSQTSLGGEAQPAVPVLAFAFE